MSTTSTMTVHDWWYGKDRTLWQSEGYVEETGQYLDIYPGLVLDPEVDRIVLRYLERGVVDDEPVLYYDSNDDTDVTAMRLAECWHMLFTLCADDEHIHRILNRLRTFANEWHVEGADALLVPLQAARDAKHAEYMAKMVREELEHQDDYSRYSLTFLDPDPTDAEKA